MTPVAVRTSAAGSIDDVVAAAVASVCDPEYPDVSIVELGLLEDLTIDGGRATVGLIPTFGGCPALSMIADDVRRAVEAVRGIEACDVKWRTTPVWSVDRISFSARRRLETDYTVTLRRPDGSLRCPECGADAVTDQSAAGPTRCRSVAWCSNCRNVVEVMR